MICHIHPDLIRILENNFFWKLAEMFSSHCQYKPQNTILNTERALFELAMPSGQNVNLTHKMSFNVKTDSHEIGWAHAFSQRDELFLFFSDPFTFPLVVSQEKLNIFSLCAHEDEQSFISMF